MSGVFINYRSVDAPLGAAAIYSILVRELGQDQVFRDCESMLPGEHYPSALRAALERADVLVVVIGPRWLDLTDDHGGRRIDAADDWVRLEIHRALERQIQIIPVLLTDLPGGEHGRLPRSSELPASIMKLAHRQTHTLSQRRFHTDVTRLTDRIVELAPAMLIPRLFVKAAELDERDCAPSVLLRPEHRVVPFVTREAELADLRSWATRPSAAAAGLMTGAAGSGRTRLAMQLCDTLTAAGWLAGVIDGEVPAAQIRETARVDKPLLAVVDDVDVRYDQLVSLAEAILARAATQAAPARLLLLGGSGTEWLSQLRHHRHRPIAALFSTIDSGSTFAVGMVAADALRQYRAASAAFAARLGLAEPSAPEPAGIDTLDSVLQVHVVALDAVLGGREAPNNQSTGGQRRRRDPLVRVAERDRRHWRQRVRDEGTAGTDTLTMSAVCTVATLCRPATEAQAEALALRLNGIMRVNVTEYLDWYQRLYPGRTAISALGPSPYGNLVLASTLDAAPWITTRLAEVGTREQIGTALTVLGRAVPERPSLSAAIVNLVRTEPNELIRLATEVADRLENPEPFVRTLASVIRTTRLDQDTVLWLMDRAAAAPRRHLDPLRSALVLVFPTEFKEVVSALLPKDVPPALATFQKVMDGIEGAMTQLTQNFLDPKATKPLLGPDGKPAVPPDLLQMLRTFQEWGRRSSDDER